MKETSETLKELRALMRQAWDRRIETDYRFWMSDAVESDEEMWRAGERDLDSLLAGIPAEALAAYRALEIGCGVGRLLRSAASRVESVVGIDVSAKAIEIASQLLADVANADVYIVGRDDSPKFENASFDLAFSFAVLGHMPCAEFSSYLIEIHRLLKDGAPARVQIYLGAEQNTVCQDTLSVRCYQEERLRAGFARCGFQVEALDELVMPFDAVDEENKIYPFVAKLKKQAACECSVEELEEILLEKKEPQASAQWAGSSLEYRMAVTRVHQLINAGAIEEARATLALAVDHFKDAEPEALAILAELERLESK